jgi:FtsP/CotA-like multicopper oxidase with cupredoxin domain
VLPNFPGNQPSPSVLHMGQAPGTMWYHAHKHGSTALDVSNGMAGAFIIEGDAYDGRLNEFYNNKRAIQFRTEDFTRQAITMVVNQLGGTPDLETGTGSFSPGGAFSINGQQRPTVTMYPGEVQLWRIVNASTISGFYLPGLPAGFAWRQLAQDGVQFDDFNYQTRAERPVFVAAGNRIDLLVKAPERLITPQNFPVTVAQGVSESQAQKQIPPNTILMTIVVREVGGNFYPMPLIPAMPPRPDFLKDIAAGEVTNTRSLTFATANAATGSSQQTIAVGDGPPQKFNEETPLKIDKLNTVEEWTILNATTGAKIDHPFHIHINPFQVTEVFDPNAPILDKSGHPVIVGGQTVPQYIFSGQPQAGQCPLNPDDPKTWKPCQQASPYPQGTNIWSDVFPIPAGTTTKNSKGEQVTVPGYFKMRSRFVDYRGSYVLHCHILAHEDRGMMMMVNLDWNPAVPMQHH